MAFTINPADFVKLFKDDRSRDRNRMIEWLEAVRYEVRIMSEIWVTLSDELEKGSSKVGALDSGFLHALNVQYPSFVRLKEFYKNLSVAVGGRMKPSVVDDLVDGLAMVVVKRGNARLAYEEAFAAMRTEGSITLLDKENSIAKLKTARDASEILQRELATLDVLIQTIKASPQAFR